MNTRTHTCVMNEKNRCLPFRLNWCEQQGISTNPPLLATCPSPHTTVDITTQHNSSTLITNVLCGDIKYCDGDMLSPQSLLLLLLLTPICCSSLGLLSSHCSSPRPPLSPYRTVRASKIMPEIKCGLSSIVSFLSLIDFEINIWNECSYIQKYAIVKTSSFV